MTTRSELLRQYIAKRIARGEFASDDRIALVGHSTGGLDIRLLLWDLAHLSNRILVDGGQGKTKAVEVDSDEILTKVDRLVFISVPQWGTNIANWVHSYQTERQLVLADLRTAVAASQVPVVDTIGHLVSGAAAELINTDLMFAIRDALREAEADPRRDAIGTAKAQEAASLLALWLRHMCTDFGAIDDLTAWSSCENDRSPAHFTSDQRDEEQEIWAEHNITTLSFATIGNNPFNFPEGRVARWVLLKPWTYPECYKDNKRAAKTDCPYRACYRACAGGPFDYPAHSEKVAVKGAQSRKSREIEVWENDGIVNTASMLWPNGGDTVLVDGDHMDIVGHYERVRSIDGRGREFQAYDLLKSGSGFSSGIFGDVWTHIFDFCVPAKTSLGAASRGYVDAVPRSRSRKR